MEFSLEHEIGAWIYNLLLKWGLEEGTAEFLKFLTILSLVLVLCIILDRVIHYFLRKSAKQLTAKTKTTFDDHLLDQKVPKRVGHIVPAYIFSESIPFIFEDYGWLIPGAEKLMSVYLTYLFVRIFEGSMRAMKFFLREKDHYKDKPIDSIVQVINAFIYFIGILVAISIVTEKPITSLLAGLGAASAVIMLVFKDSLLGFTGSIQLAANDMVRVGDWITVPKYGADGDVIEVGVTTVKVKNFDNTLTTVPTYALISDSFQNWRGMVESGGRRIKRAMFIKVSSIHFLTEEDVERMKKIELIAQFIEKKETDIKAFHTKNNINKDTLINGRNLTNVGVFRKYMEAYAKQNPAINERMTLMARQLAPTANGLPLEIYCFSQDKVWVNYEHIMSDLFDHYLAALRYFGLEIHEAPTSSDVIAAFGKSHEMELDSKQ